MVAQVRPRTALRRVSYSLKRSCGVRTRLRYLSKDVRSNLFLIGISSSTRSVKSRLSNALRMSAQNLHRSESALGDWFRRLRSKLGAKGAITAAAHKLARILYAMVKTRKPYNPKHTTNQVLHKQRKEKSLRRQAKLLGFQLTPIEG